MLEKKTPPPAVIQLLLSEENSFKRFKWFSFAYMGVPMAVASRLAFGGVLPWEIGVHVFCRYPTRDLVQQIDSSPEQRHFPLLWD